MIISSIGPTPQPGGPNRAHRPQAAAPSLSPDSVRLSGGRVGGGVPALPLAAQALTTAAGAAPAPGVARPALEELRQAAERLQAQGMKLEHRPKVLFWTLGYRESGPEQVAKLSEKPDRARVVRADDRKVPLQSSDDLILLDALYGKADVSQLQNPPLARALLALEKAHPTQVDAYSAYLAGERLNLRVGSEYLYRSEDAIAMAYLGGLVPSPEGLHRPGQAESLHTLRQAGYETGGFTAYRELESSYGEAQIEKNGILLDELQAEHLKDPAAALARVQAMEQAWSQLSARLGEKAPSALLAVRHASSLALADRVALAERVYADQAKDPAGIFHGVIEAAPDGQRLEEWLAVGKTLDQTLTQGGCKEALLALRKVTPEGQAPTQSLVESFQRLHPTLRDAKLAAACSAALEKTTRPPDEPEKILERFTPLCSWRDSAAHAFITLAEHDRLNEDSELLASMIQSTSDVEYATSAYGTLRREVPPEHQELYLELWKQAPRSDMKQTWQAVYRPDPQACQQRKDAWMDAVSKTRRGDHSSSRNRTDHYSKILADLPDGPEFEWRAAMLNLVVEGAQGEMGRAGEVWERLQTSSDLETAARLYGATGNQQKASRAAEVLTRTDLSGDFSHESRRNALASLIGALKGDVDLGVRAYAHLMTVSGPDLDASARDFSQLLAGCGDEEKGRLAWAACRTSPPVPGSPTAAQSLVQALHVHNGDLGAARPLWSSLEKPEGNYAYGNKVANLKVASSSKLPPDEVVSLYQWMTDQRLDQEGRQAVIQVMASQGEFAEKMALARVVAPNAPERKALVGAMTELAKVPARELASVLQVLRGRATSADFNELVSGLGKLSGLTLEKTERLLAAHEPGDSYAALGALLQVAGDQFEAMRTALGEGTVEGTGRPENTRWLMSGQSSDLRVLKEQWAAVRNPVGNESTSDRRQQFDRLERNPAAWRAVTSWMQPGESLSEAVDAALKLRTHLTAAVPGDANWLKMLEEVRARQSSGELEHLSLKAVSERAERAVLGAGSESLLQGERPTLQSVLEKLCESSVGATGIREGEHHVVIGGVRVATR